MMTVLSVSKLNFYLRALLEGDAPLQNLYVSGEISNFKRYPTSGHCYFTLRDEKAQLKCVLFAAQGAHLRFAPENGMRVICRGRVSVYERDGVYQLYVDDMQPQGAGALAVAFEQLKSRLAAAGLFDESHKQPIPKYPGRIGVATSAYGAAVADIKQITARRFPAAELVIAPTVVQGDGAPLDPEAETQVLYIVQEALSNVRKHAGASTVSVSVRRGRDGLAVTVRDDGIGFAEDRDATDGEAHIGLQIMRERALRIGGRFAVRSSPGRGSEIRLELPRTNEVEA